MRDGSDGMLAISQALKESDMAKYEVEKDRVELEKRRYEQEVLENAADRAMQQEERDLRRQESAAQREFMLQLQSDSKAQLQAILALVEKIVESKK